MYDYRPVPVRVRLSHYDLQIDDGYHLQSHRKYLETPGRCDLSCARCLIDRIERDSSLSSPSLCFLPTYRIYSKSSFFGTRVSSFLGTLLVYADCYRHRIFYGQTCTNIVFTGFHIKQDSVFFMLKLFCYTHVVDCMHLQYGSSLMVR